MKIKIREVVEDEDGHWVRVDSPVGLFWAIWGAGRATVGHEYHVELEVDQLLQFGESAMEINAISFAIRGDDRSLPVIMVGRIIEVYPEQGTVLLQVGDSILQVELEGQVSPDSWVQCQVSRLKIYDENL